ncbi:hypothetical protein L208DRAFT_1381990 [Tricholoma matsutake]|nr:hypothetical protein L208DRAFT_1381990 [Tricholoma matsutake 945]
MRTVITTWIIGAGIPNVIGLGDLENEDKPCDRIDLRNSKKAGFSFFEGGSNKSGLMEPHLVLLDRREVLLILLVLLAHYSIGFPVPIAPCLIHLHPELSKGLPNFGSFVTINWLAVDVFDEARGNIFALGSSSLPTLPWMMVNLILGKSSREYEALSPRVGGHGESSGVSALMNERPTVCEGPDSPFEALHEWLEICKLAQEEKVLTTVFLTDYSV